MSSRAGSETSLYRSSPLKPSLSHAHEHTYNAILRHPSAHNLQWHDVRSLLDALADVTDEANGKVKVTRNGRSILVHPGDHKDFDGEGQIASLRNFLEQSNEGTTPPVVRGVDLLVVIDHREARIYKTELSGTVPERIVPHDSDGSGRYLHEVENDASGQRRPERKSFYEAIASSLRGADRILLFGGGTGASSAMEHLVSELQAHHKDLAGKIVGSVAVDEHHLSEDQLLARARTFYEALASTPATQK